MAICPASGTSANGIDLVRALLRHDPMNALGLAHKNKERSNLKEHQPQKCADSGHPLENNGESD